MSDEQFWHKLRRSAETAERRELDEAERLLRELDDAPVEPLSRAEVDALVARARARADEEGDDGGGANVLAGPSAPRPGRAGWLAAAAAFVLTPKFLVAGTAAAAIAIAAYGLRDTTKTLDFAHAVDILKDASESEADRLVAQGTVYLDVVGVILKLQDLRANDPDLAGLATDALERLRITAERLASGRGLTDQAGDADAVAIRPLLDTLNDLTRTSAERATALQDIVRQARLGLEEMARSSRGEQASLKDDATKQLTRIATLLRR